MESPSHQQQDLVLGPGAGTEQNDEVCVTFVIRGGDSATLERIQRLIKIRQANGEALVEGQTRLAEYQEFQQSRDDVALLDTLQDSRAQIAELEDRIADVERAGRVRAKEALSLAEERRVELRQKLEDQHDVLVGYDKELRDLTEKYDYYAEIRDRCIKVRILQEIASGDEEALAARLKLLAERIRHFSREAAEVAGLVESAKAELEQTVVELQLPRKVRHSQRPKRNTRMGGSNIVNAWCLLLDVAIDACLCFICMKSPIRSWKQSATRHSNSCTACMRTLRSKKQFLIVVLKRVRQKSRAASLSGSMKQTWPSARVTTACKS